MAIDGQQPNTLKHLNASVQAYGNVMLVLSCRGARRVFEFPDVASYFCSDRMFFPRVPRPRVRRSFTRSVSLALSSIIHSKFLMRPTVFYIYYVFREVTAIAL